MLLILKEKQNGLAEMHEYFFCDQTQSLVHNPPANIYWMADKNDSLQ